MCRDAVAEYGVAQEFQPLVRRGVASLGTPTSVRHGKLQKGGVLKAMADAIGK